MSDGGLLPSATKIASSPSPATSTSNWRRSTSTALTARPSMPSFRSRRAAALASVTCGPPRITRASGLTDRMADAILTAAGSCGVVAVIPKWMAVDWAACSRTTSS